MEQARRSAVRSVAKKTDEAQGGDVDASGLKGETAVGSASECVAYYPPLSDNRYKGLIYWWTFAELRADPTQLARYVDAW